ncbi:MAG: hypothetical protein V1850_04205 [Candidatus Bathyarchaeota archaeon]
MKPEEKARQKINFLLNGASWEIQDVQKLNLEILDMTAPEKDIDFNGENGEELSPLASRKRVEKQLPRILRILESTYHTTFVSDKGEAQIRKR